MLRVMSRPGLLSIKEAMLQIKVPYCVKAVEMVELYNISRKHVLRLGAMNPTFRRHILFAISHPMWTQDERRPDYGQRDDIDGFRYRRVRGWERVLRLVKVGLNVVAHCFEFVLHEFSYIFCLVCAFCTFCCRF